MPSYEATITRMRLLPRNITTQDWRSDYLIPRRRRGTGAAFPALRCVFLTIWNDMGRPFLLLLGCSGRRRRLLMLHGCLSSNPGGRKRVYGGHGFIRIRGRWERWLKETLRVMPTAMLVQIRLARSPRHQPDGRRVILRHGGSGRPHGAGRGSCAADSIRDSEG